MRTRGAAQANGRGIRPRQRRSPDGMTAGALADRAASERCRAGSLRSRIPERRPRMSSRLLQGGLDDVGVARAFARPSRLAPVGTLVAEGVAAVIVREVRFSETQIGR